jgi:Fic family protein
MKKNKKKVDTKEPVDSGFSVLDEFLMESNHIEMIYDVQADLDARDAWDYLIEKDELTVNDVLEAHGILMRNLNPRIAGKLRDCDVYIGGKRKYFISETLLKEELDNFCESLNKTIPKKGGIGDVKGNPSHTTAVDHHVIFEDLHPFEDGNGRVGRIIYNWHRVLMGLPIHVIHADWPNQKGEQAYYYTWFKQKLSTN